MNKIAKCIGVRLLNIRLDQICEDTIESAERWLSAKEPEHRTYCPFILRHQSCELTCGAMLEGWPLKKIGCPRFVLTPTEMATLVETIRDEGEKRSKKGSINILSFGI